LQRSDSQYDLNKLNNKLIALFTLIGGSHKIANIASGLKEDINNRLALQIQHISQHKFNHPVTLSPIHAVLEMGEIAKNYPNIVAASLGVNIKNPHTPKEMVEIKSILYTYELLKEVAKSIK
jgi:dipeptidase D